ncbi:MAG: hypothetical protein AAGF54_03050 [Pseudomonadota bacterium]
MEYIQSLFSGEQGQGVQLVAISFALVICLILIFWIVRQINSAPTRKANKNRTPRLSITDSTRVDDKRYFVLIRRDNIEHLVLIGGGSDLVVESGIVRAKMPTKKPGQVATQPQVPTHPPKPANTSVETKPEVQEPEQKPQVAVAAVTKEPEAPAVPVSKPTKVPTEPEKPVEKAEEKPSEKTAVAAGAATVAAAAVAEPVISKITGSLFGNKQDKNKETAEKEESGADVVVETASSEDIPTVTQEPEAGETVSTENVESPDGSINLSDNTESSSEVEVVEAISAAPEAPSQEPEVAAIEEAVTAAIDLPEPEIEKASIEETSDDIEASDNEVVVEVPAVSDSGDFEVTLNTEDLAPTEEEIQVSTGDIPVDDAAPEPQVAMDIDSDSEIADTVPEAEEVAAVEPAVTAEVEQQPDEGPQVIEDPTKNNSGTSTEDEMQRLLDELSGATRETA